MSRMFSRRSVAHLAAAVASVGILGASLIASQPVAALAPGGAAVPAADALVQANWLTTAPIVDGNLDEWSGVQRYPLDNQNASAPSPEERPQPSDLSAWASFVWTTDNLYIALNVVDNVVVRTHRNWVQDDMAQFTLDVDSSGGPSQGDVYLTVSPDGLITNGGLLPLGYQASAARNATGWQAEIAIPTHEFGADFLNDAQVGFTWGVQDNDGHGLKGYLVWAGSDFSVPTPQQGTLRFANGPTREWIKAGPGVGFTDATLDQWHPNDKLGTSPTLSLRGDEQWNVVFKFDPPALPANAKPLKARVHMQVYDRSNTGTTWARLYRLLHTWDENTTTWLNADAAHKWSIGGANGRGSDRSDEVVSQTLLNIKSGEVVWEIGPDVIGDLYANPDKNFGFVMRAEEGNSVLYTMRSSECTTPANCAPWIEVFVEKPPALASTAAPEAVGAGLPEAVANPR